MKASQLYEAGITSFRRTADPRTILIESLVGRAHVIVGYSTHEDAKTVKVTVQARYTSDGWNALVGYWMPVLVTLDEPLGDRIVVDARTGRQLRDADVRTPAAGVIEAGSFRNDAGVIDLRWNDPTGSHALSELRGSTVALLTRDNKSGDAKLNWVALEAYLHDAPAEERARTAVILITFGRFLWDAFAPNDTPFRALLAELDSLTPDLPEILQPAATPAMWFIGPDGLIRERIVGRGATADELRRALAAAR
ncbi:MAG: hypothetical protein E6I87_01265 [Chloroflexi bacterium]|nr:MAG: hypothetical protein E6I87_01265 [Chloroflexota bacterium]